MKLKGAILSALCAATGGTKETGANSAGMCCSICSYSVQPFVHMSSRAQWAVSLTNFGGKFEQKEMKATERAIFFQGYE
jgi:hypothetical protein